MHSPTTNPFRRLEVAGPWVPSSKIPEHHHIDLIPAGGLKHLAHVGQFHPYVIVEFETQPAVDPVAVENGLREVEEDLVVGGQVQRVVQHVRLAQGYIEKQEIARPHPEVTLDPALLEAVAVQQFDPPERLPGDVLLEDPVLVDVILVFAVHIVLRQDVAVA